ncbi:MAG: hypothetical protein HUK25_08330, partial [Treponema sp.]|nr:hypothetical protein [Treponema sp.]
MKKYITIHLNRGGRSAGLVLLFCLISLPFFSCKNFLTSDNMRELLQAEVAYARAPEITVRVQLGDDSTGTTFPSGDVTKKKGYAFEVSYESNDKNV